MAAFHHYTEKEKDRALWLLACGLSLAKAAKEFGCSQSALHKWKQEAEKSGKWKRILAAAKKKKAPRLTAEQLAHHKPRQGSAEPSPWLGHCVRLEE